MTIRPINALRADKENDNTLLSPLECLTDVIADIEEKRVEPNKLIVIGLDTGDDDLSYDVRYWLSNMRSSEVLALLDTTKILILESMNFIPGHRP